MKQNTTIRRWRGVASGATPLLLIGWMGASAASAAIHRTGCTELEACTFQELLGGGSITAGGQRFASFAIEDDPGTMDWSHVVVTGLDDMGLSPGPGLDFAHNGEAIANGTDSLDLQFSYTVTPVITSWQPVANELEMISSGVAGTGRVEVDATLFDATHAALGDKTIATDDAFDETRVFDAIEFPPQASGLIVSNSITVEGQDPSDQAELGVFVQRFALSPVPEPSLVPVLATGACWLAALGQQRSRNRRVPVEHRPRAQDVPIHVVPQPGETNR